MNSLWGNIFKMRQKEEDEILGILKKIPIFEELGKRDLERVERLLHKRQYSSDEVIFVQGDPGLGMYIIEKGNVDIISEPGKNRLADLSDGEFFGELALLDDSPRTASAVATTDCTLLCFFQPDLLDLVERNPQLGVKILFHLARTVGARLRKANELIREIPSVGGTL